MDFSNGGKAQVGFLQPHAAGFEDDHGTCGNAVAVVFHRQLQRAGNLGAGHFAHAAALEGAFNGEHHRGMPAQRAARHHDAIIGLRDDALTRQPRRGQLFERVQ